jgi:hypothetical protein
VLVAHACNPSYSRGRDQEDRSSKSAVQIVHETLSQKTLHVLQETKEPPSPSFLSVLCLVVSGWSAQHIHPNSRLFWSCQTEPLLLRSSAGTFSRCASVPPQPLGFCLAPCLASLQACLSHLVLAHLWSCATSPPIPYPPTSSPGV